ncbi:MAG: calcium-binding protein [Patescibacteria group bacterium]
MRSGFSLVEIIIVVAVIGILATIAVLGLSRFQADSRDSQRKADIGVISERLEKYFDKYGAYPSCTALQGDVTAVSSGLVAIEGNALAAPTSTTPNSSSVKCATLATDDDSYAYIGADCVVDEGCGSWQLQYSEENSNTTVTIQSRRIATDIPTVPAEEVPTPPAPGQAFTIAQIEDICEDEAIAPSGYNIMHGAGMGATTTGTSGPDLIYAGSGANIIYGGAGNDILCGNTGADILYGDDGVDYIIGGSGSDTLRGGLGNDLLSGLSGSDQIYGNDGDDILYGGSGIDTLDGGIGNDKANDPSNGNYVSIETIF